MKIIVICPNCDKVMNIKDAIFSPLGELRISLSDCGCMSCADCDEVDVLNKKIDELEQQLNNLENDFEDKDNEIEGLLNQIDNKDNEIEILEQRLEAIQDR